VISLVLVGRDKSAEGVKREEVSDLEAIISVNKEREGK